MQAQKLAELKQLTKKAQDFMNEGNQVYAIRCYDKVIIILKELYLKSTSPETAQQLKAKAEKYVTMKALAEKKRLEKEEKPKPKVGFGFPLNGLSKIREAPKEIKSNKSQDVYVRPVEPQRKKPLFKQHMKTETCDDPVAAQAIVKNLDVTFKDIVGLSEVKQILQEAVIRPRQRPDLYTGIRAPPRGLLLYGPPGNGKTYICKALAKESGCTFFALSASSVLNKLVGESEKTIKRIFAAAEKMAPSIIFIDEIDSMLTARSQNQNQASRRLKTEFLVLMDGISSAKSGDILVIGATNLPKELDSAAKRRFNKMVLIPNPDPQSRRQLLHKYLKQVEYDLSKSEQTKIVDKLDCYSASQIRNIVSQACMGPLRELKKSEFQKIQLKKLRRVGFKDIMSVINDRKPILTREQLAKYKQKM